MMMLGLGKVSVEEAAPRMARALLGNGKSSLLRGVCAPPRKVLLSTRSGLDVRQGGNRLAVMKLPRRPLSDVHKGEVEKDESGSTTTSGTINAPTADLEAVWNEAVDNGLVDTPEETASMKDEDAVFWGSVSEDVRNTPEQIYAYFVHQTRSKATGTKKTVVSDVQRRWGLVSVDISRWLPPHPFLKPKTSFPVTSELSKPGRSWEGPSKDYLARLPELRMVEYTPVGVRVFGGFAIQAGAYTFGWQGADGATVETQAHFSFKFRREREGWSIVDHQSSAMPREPEELKHVDHMAGLKMLDTTPGEIC